MLKRIAQLSLLIAGLSLAGTIVAGPKTDKGPPPADWRIKSIEIPGAEETAWGYNLGIHGKGLLVVRAGADSETLWWMVDGKFRKVMHEKRQLAGSYLYIDVDGDTSLVTVKGDSEVELFIIREGEASRCYPPVGMEELPENFVVTRQSGHIVFRESDEDGELGASYVLHGDRMFAPRLPDGQEGEVKNFILAPDFDGRTRVLVYGNPGVDDGYFHLGEKGQLLKIETPELPKQLRNKDLVCRTWFFDGYSVTCGDTEDFSETYVWTNREDKAELLKDQDGNVLSHDTYLLWPMDDAMWLIGTDIGDFPADDRVKLYRLQDGRAVPVALPKQLERGDHTPVSIHDPLYMDCRNARGSRDLWLVQEDELIQLKTENGRTVPVPEDIYSFKLGERQLCGLIESGRGPVYLLDGETLKSFPLRITTSTPFDQSEWLFQLGGELVAMQYADEGHELRHIFLRDSEYTHRTFSLPDGTKLSGVDLEVRQLGDKLYISVDAYGENPGLFEISR